jgi:cbb3-type cytochrome oxidase maturation protein
LRPNFAALNKSKMSVLFVLIAVSITVALGFLGAFLWSVRSGQYEDDYTPAIRMLFDNDIEQKVNTKTLNKPDLKDNL